MMNCIQLLGRVTKDAEKRNFDNGNSMMEFSVVIDNGYYNKTSNEWQEKPNFFDVKFFRDKTIDKGDLVAIVGKLVQEKWTNNEGQNRSKILINADRVRVIKKSENNAEQSSGYQPNAPAPPPTNLNTETDDDLPF